MTQMGISDTGQGPEELDRTFGNLKKNPYIFIILYFKLRCLCTSTLYIQYLLLTIVPPPRL